MLDELGGGNIERELVPELCEKLHGAMDPDDREEILKKVKKVGGRVGR
jgi:hypothetical protein